MKPGPDFEDKVQTPATEYLAGRDIPAEMAPLVDQWKQYINTQAADNLTRRLGWFTRAHSCILDDGTMLVGFYSEGSVQFVGEFVDLGTYRAQSTMSGGEVVAFQ
jgi:hypothetical protein